MDLLYPSAAFPAPPSLRLTVPDSWEAFVAADATVAAFDTASPAEFRVNIVVVVSRVVGAATLDAMVEQMHAVMRQNMAGVELHDSTRAELAGHDTVLSAFTIDGEEVPFPLFQAEAALLVPTTNDDVRDLVQIHGTCPATMAEEYGSIFRSIMDSLALG